MCQHNLPCSIVYAHCLLPRRAFASLYVLLGSDWRPCPSGRQVDLLNALIASASADNTGFIQASLPKIQGLFKDF